MSPERIAPEQFGFTNGRPTIASDCFALGMVIYEIISGNLPFHKYTDIQVSLKVVKGEQPHRGVKFTEDLWKMLKRCWVVPPGSRPGIEDVLQCLETESRSPDPPALGINEETEEEGDAWDSTSGTSGVLDGVGDTMMTESTTATSSDSSYLTDTPLSPASTASESITRTDSNNRGPHQVSTI